MANGPELAPTRWSLVARIKDLKDDASWSCFVSTYRRILYAQAIKYGLTPTESEDALQEILLAVANKIETLEYDPDSFSFKAWLFTVSRHRIIDRLRKQARERRVILPRSDAMFEWLRRGMAEPSDDDGDTDTTFENRNEWIDQYQYHDRGDTVHRELYVESVIDRAKEELRGTVSARDYQVFESCTIHRKKPSDVGRFLDMSVMAVYKINYRTRIRFVELARSIFENSDVHV